jgi:polyphenol oxidase
MKSPFLKAPGLDFPGIRHGFSTRTGGVSTGTYASFNCGLGSNEDRARVLQNRAFLAGSFGVAAGNLVVPYQAHTNVCETVTVPFSPDQVPRADAVVTATPGLLLGVSTADCVPVLFADPVARVVGAAHAGWRGALGGILQSTVLAMTALGAQPGNIHAVIGPAIRQPNYEVGPDLVAAFGPENARFFAPGTRDNHPMFDLTGYVAMRLKDLGLQHVDDLGLCTYADEARFYSYRRMTHRGEPDYGRHVHVIGLLA